MLPSCREKMHLWGAENEWELVHFQFLQLHSVLVTGAWNHKVKINTCGLVGIWKHMNKIDCLSMESL